MTRTVAILGPTAVGKSELGMELAQRFAGEIISADALQVYRGFDIGTAKPSLQDRQRVEHYLVDILEPEESFSAGEFARRARERIEDILHRRRQPLVLGGSGLYLRALLEGISSIPAIDPAIRHRLRRRLESEGPEALRRHLDEIDPITAARLLPGDTQRTLRALEVALATGKPLSAWQDEDPTGRGPLPVVRIGLTLPRTVLYDRIAERVRLMIQAGWVEEVENLLRGGLKSELPAFQAIGYRQLAAYLRGETCLEEAVTDTVRATCRYAKRQLTWFRQESAVEWFSMEDARSCHQEVIRFLERSGIGGENGQT